MGKKICFAASSGGHYEQLMMLKPLMEEYESFIVTEHTEYKTENKDEKTYYMQQVNRRENTFVIKMFINLMRALFKGKTRCCDLYRCISNDSDLCNCKSNG